MAVQKKSSDEQANNTSAAFVKVSMDGAPYLRKVDLKLYKSYQDLSDALGKMFSSFTIGMITYNIIKEQIAILIFTDLSTIYNTYFLLSVNS